MTTFRLALALTAVCSLLAARPIAGRAQDARPEPTPQTIVSIEVHLEVDGTLTITSPPPLPAPPSAPEPERTPIAAAQLDRPSHGASAVRVKVRDSGSRVPRILVESLVGATAGVALGAAGGGIGAALCDPSPSVPDDSVSSGGWDTTGFSDAIRCTMSAIFGAMVGYTIGVPVGVFFTGLLMDGNGGLGWTLLGATAGWVAGFALIAAGGEGAMNAFGALALVMPLSGTVLAYELSSDTSATAMERPIRVSVAPTARGSGLMLGATGAW